MELEFFNRNTGEWWSFTINWMWPWDGFLLGYQIETPNELQANPYYSLTFFFGPIYFSVVNGNDNQLS